MIIFVPFHHLEYVLPSTYQQVAVIAKSYRRKAEKLFHLYERGWVFGHPHTGDHILLHLFTQIHGYKAARV